MRLWLPLVLILSTLASDAVAGVYLTIIRRPNGGLSQREIAAAEARRQLATAQSEFTRAYNKAVLNNPYALELKQAQLSLAKSRQQLAGAIAEAKLELNKRADYRTTNAEIWSLEEKLSHEKDVAKRMETAHTLFAVRRQRTAIEIDGFSGDASLTVASAGVTEAMSNLRNAEQIYQWHMTKDPGFAAAKSSLDAVRQRMANLGA